MPSTHATRSVLVVLLSLFTLLVSTSQVGAQAPTNHYTFTVNTTADTHDAHPGDGTCADKQGNCSLRAAIEAADALPSGSNITITVPAGTYQLRLGSLYLKANTVTITGAGRWTTLINGRQQFTVMSISPHVSVSLSQLTIENGYGNVYNSSGGIYNQGTLSVSKSAFIHNSVANGFFGGGIYNDGGTLSVSASIFSHNWATAGGGIENNNGELTVSDSTFSHNSIGLGRFSGVGAGIDNELGTASVTTSTFSLNRADGEGGGISNVSGILIVTNSIFSYNVAQDGGGIGNDGYNGPGQVSVSNSTISHNSALAGGGIENVSSIMHVISSTISNNAASSEGGGIVNAGAMLSVRASTFSGNSGGVGAGIDNSAGATLSMSNSTFSGGGIDNNPGSMATLTATIVANSPKVGNCIGQITDGGYNLDSGATCHFHLKTDLTKTDPLLGPLHNNGGPTKTLALRQGSKAIDWVALSRCPGTDQRGYPRPDNSETTCDIGAYESSY